MADGAIDSRQSLVLEVTQTSQRALAAIVTKRAAAAGFYVTYFCLIHPVQISPLPALVQWTD